MDPVINSSKHLSRLSKKLYSTRMEENKELGHGKVWEWPTMVEKNCEDRGTMEIVCLLCL